MEYHPIRSVWIVLGVILVAVLAALCEMAGREELSFPLVLWQVPVILLTGAGISLATVLVRRARARVQSRRPRA